MEVVERFRPLAPQNRPQRGDSAQFENHCTKAYFSALQPFLIRCTLKDILTNSCTLFTDTSPVSPTYLNSCL